MVYCSRHPSSELYLFPDYKRDLIVRRIPTVNVIRGKGKLDEWRPHRPRLASF